jgi:deazaflavin-dependent oxidoreductase (nitroreductase family)
MPKLLERHLGGDAMSDEIGAKILRDGRDFIEDHLQRYLRSGGTEGHIVDVSHVVGYPFSTHCLIRYRGRKSGRTYITPLLYGDVRDEVVICASNGGMDRHPQWYLNVRETPDIQFQVATQAFEARWREPKGDERNAMWRSMVDMFPLYSRYQRSTARMIPLVMMTATASIPVFKVSNFGSPFPAASLS